MGARISGKQFIRSLVERGIIPPGDDIYGVSIVLDYADPVGLRSMEELAELGVIGPIDDMRSVEIEAAHDDVVLIHTEQVGTTRLLEMPFEDVTVNRRDPSTPRTALEVTKVGFNLDKYR